MEKLNLCPKGGILVWSGRNGGYVPDDPHEFYLGVENEVVGCSRLKCLKCGQQVTIERDPVPLGQDYRAYSCDCTTHLQDRQDRTADEDDQFDPYLPWQCSGHPIVQLPAGVDGVEITSEADLRSVARRALAGWSPDASRAIDRKGIGWLKTLHARFVGSELDGIVSRVAADGMTDPDPRARAAALHFLNLFPFAPGAERIEDLVAGDRSLFTMRDPLNSEATIEDSLLGLLGRRVQHRDAAPRSLALAREELLRPGCSDELFDFLGADDEDWLVRNAEAIVRANPKRWRALLEGLEDRDSLTDVGVRLAGLPEVDPDALRRHVNKTFAQPGKSVVLGALDQRQGGGNKSKPSSKAKP